MEDLKRYISDNREKMLSELFDLLRIPSVSAVKSHGGDMRRTAEAIKKALLEKARTTPA